MDNQKPQIEEERITRWSERPKGQ